jgi:hypothetical protein
MDIRTLKSRWGWTTLLTFVAMAVLGYVGERIKAASGFGIFDLEFATTAEHVSKIVAAWQSTGVADEAGFMLGFDYLFMPLYGLALFYGVLAAREAFARSHGVLRRILTGAAIAPLVGAGLDAVENLLEARMLFVGLEPDLTRLAYTVTVIKFFLIIVGFIAALAGVWGLVTRRLKTGSPRSVA